MEIALGILLIVLAAVLVVCVLLQSGKDKKLSSTITGSADTFFSKGKSKSKDKMLSTATTILAIVFVVVAFAAVLVITALN
ncbi:MAG: preprotein translocase subunit SecG [Ruminococcaceae bacterium]|nr:preprotein translocase subunit SecG [Oscillospiraceae bacterium]